MGCRGGARRYGALPRERTRERARAARRYEARDPFSPRRAIPGCHREERAISRRGEPVAHENTPSRPPGKALATSRAEPQDQGVTQMNAARIVGILLIVAGALGLVYQQFS